MEGKAKEKGVAANPFPTSQLILSLVRERVSETRIFACALRHLALHYPEQPWEDSCPCRL